MRKELKYAVVFAGQGAQKPGMGKSLYEASPAAREVFDLAGEEIKHFCFEADEEALKQTEVTQPAVFAMDMAAYAALREALGLIPGENGESAKNRKNTFPAPAAVAGFSLGEYAAFAAAGVIDSLETGLSLVRKRSLLMKEAGSNPDGSQKGAMAACIGDREGTLGLVEKARGTGILEAVNFNSPQQIVVAGDVAAVERLVELSQGVSGVKVKMLPVSGAFHSPIMKPAAEGLAGALEGYVFGAPSLPVYLNVTGGTFDEYRFGCDRSMPEADCVYATPEAAVTDAKVKAIMVRQIQSPVYWQTTIEAMVAASIEAIIEVGPGKTLTGLAKKIAPDVKALNVEDADSLAATVAALLQQGQPGALL